MRTLMTLLLTIFLTQSASFGAEPPANRSVAHVRADAKILPPDGAPKVCDSSQLLLLPNNAGGASTTPSFLFRLGESLHIALRDQCAAQLTGELTKKEAANAVRLYLDNVPMAELPVTVLQGASEKELILAFHLTRISQEDPNRKSWDKLLGKQHNSYVMQLPIALAIGNEVAIATTSASSFQFYVATEEKICWTIVCCLAVFALSYGLLVYQSGALQDEKTGVYSLGKSQMAFWGLLSMLTFAGIWFLTGTMERIPEQVLILLGISGATGLSAIVISGAKKATEQAKLQEKRAAIQEQLQNREATTAEQQAFSLALENCLQLIDQQLASLPGTAQPPKTQGFWRDICDDGNGLSFHRMQVVIWTLLLGMVFVRSVAETMSMPEFPETLLIMMGISNGVYLGFKFPEKP